MDHGAILAIFDGIDEPVYVSDTETHEVLFVNRVAREVFGAPAGKKCYGYLQGRTGPCPFCTNDRILGDHQGRSYVWEFRNEANGRWYKCIDKAIPWTDGRLVRYEMAIDITGLKDAEDSVGESDRRLRALSDNLPRGLVYQIDSGADGAGRNFTYISRGVEELHEMSVAEAMEDPARIYGQIHEADRGLVREREGEALRTMTPLSVEVRVVLPSGRTGWRLFTSAPRRLPNGHLVWDGIEIDITDRRRAEQERERLREELHQAQKMESVGRLAGGVAHDFNNMLSVIVGHTELALERVGPSDPLGAELREIRSAAEHSAALTRQLLAFARLGRMVVAPVDVHAAIREVAGLLGRVIDRRIDIGLDLRASRAVVMGDGSQIQAMFLNLGLNARDAMPDGGRVTFSSRDAPAGARRGGDPHPGDLIEIAVTDTGIGIEEQFLDRIFEPFFTTKARGKGTGLGLASVYGCVKSHGGSVGVESSPGRGTEFRVLLPVADAEPRAAAAPKTGVVGGRGRVLLVDDEAMVRALSERMLARLGYTVFCCFDGRDAVEFFRREYARVDIVLLDLIMPRLDGAGAFREMRRIRPDARVLLCSGFERDGRIEGLLAEGALGFLSKPYTLAQLSSQIAGCLDAGGAE